MTKNGRENFLLQMFLSFIRVTKPNYTFKVSHFFKSEEFDHGGVDIDTFYTLLTLYAGQLYVFHFKRVRSWRISGV